ncbi:MAG: serine hydrolase domain-containing protein [Acidimicrobiales bacterium]
MVAGRVRPLVLLLAALLMACSADDDADVDPANAATEPSDRPASTVTATTPEPVAFGFPAQPDGVPFPTVEWPEAEWPAAVDRAAVDAATETALAGGGDERVRAVVIVHGGELVYERYSPNPEDGPDVVMPSWSVAKSIASALIGILVRDGRLDIDEPAPVPEWRAHPEDPHAGITTRHLLEMSSGLAWFEGQDSGASELTMMSRDDTAHYASTLPMASAPGTEFLYNGGGTQLLSRMIAAEVGSGDDLRAFMDAELFDKLGMDPVETKFDGVGTWVASHSADTTARDLARFGLLYARGGLWDGERILDEEWVHRTRTPSQANLGYGLHWWLDPLRPEILYASGILGQTVTVDPAHDLVIVQLSTVGGPLPRRQTETILDAFAASGAR